MVALPIVLLALVVLHLLALHEVGSNNPDGVDIKKHKDENGVPLDGVKPSTRTTRCTTCKLSACSCSSSAALFSSMPEMGGFFIEYAELRGGELT